MGLKDMVNEMLIEEAIQGMLTKVDDKEMIKEKGQEALNMLDKIDDNMCVLLLKLNGKVHISLTKKDNILEFDKDPDFINIEDIVRKTIDSI